MFNLLVSGADGVWESGQRMRMRAERFGEMSGDEAGGISHKVPDTLTALEHTEAILMYEMVLSGAKDARVGHVHSIRVDGMDVTFRFTEMGRIPREELWKLRHRLQIEDWGFHRTHWAMKDGSIPQDILSTMVVTPKRYDVVLSFAGEDRTYVEKVATALEARGVVVFYDKFEQATLWGKDLAEHLDSLYRLQARYCVMFVSTHYAEKVWTKHEKRAALARALVERTEYVLPARFDDTEVPGLRPTIGFIDLRLVDAEGLAQLILQKLGRT